MWINFMIVRDIYQMYEIVFTVAGLTYVDFLNYCRYCRCSSKKLREFWVCNNTCYRFGHNFSILPVVCGLWRCGSWHSQRGTILKKSMRVMLFTVLCGRTYVTAGCTSPAALVYYHKSHTISSDPVCCRHGRFNLELTTEASHSQQEAQLSQWDALTGGLIAHSRSSRVKLVQSFSTVSQRSSS